MNRRTFALTAGGVLAAGRAFSANDAIEIGMIGLGGRGSYLLERNLMVHGVRVTHLCDINPAALDKAQTAAARDNPKGVTDYRELLQVDGINAVYIATPCHLHREMAVAALKAGKHVYCEKPLAITPEDVRAVVDAAKGAKGILQVGHNRRYGKLTRRVVERIHAGEIGKLLFIRGQYWTPRDLPHHQAWKFDRSKFGDMIVEQAVHCLDMFNWYFQGPPVRACGLGGANLYINDPPGRTIMDHYTISYEYPNDTHVNFSHIYYAIGDLAGVGEVVIGADGAVVTDRAGVKFYDRSQAKVVEELRPDKTDSDTLNCVQDFIDCIREGRQPFTDAEVGKRSALASIMGLRSMLERRVVEWKEVDV